MQATINLQGKFNPLKSLRNSVPVNPCKNQPRIAQISFVNIRMLKDLNPFALLN